MAKSWHHGDSGFSVKWFSTRTQKLSGVGKQLLGPWSSIQQMTLRLRCYFDYTVRPRQYDQKCAHYSGVIMSMMASQNTVVSIVCSTVCSGAHQRKDQSSASLAFVRGIHGWPVNSPPQTASNAESVSVWWRHHEEKFSYSKFIEICFWWFNWQ